MGRVKGRRLKAAPTVQEAGLRRLAHLRCQRLRVQLASGVLLCR